MTVLQRIAGALGLLSLLSSPACGQAGQWATAFPSTVGTADIRTTAVDITDTGDVYAAYQFYGSITLAGQTFTAPGTTGNDRSTVIAHHTAAGNVVSILLVGAYADIYELRHNVVGEIYAVGRFLSPSGQLTTDGQQLSSSLASSVFVMKWDVIETFDWIREGDIPNPGSIHLALDEAGDVTLSSLFTGTATFSTRSVTSTPSSVLLAHYTTNGQLRWLRGLNGQTSPVWSNSVAAAPDGTIYVVGSCPGSGFTWGSGTGSGTVPASGPRAGFWLKLDSNGGLLAHQRFGSNSNVFPLIATDVAGIAYVAAICDTSAFRWGNATFSVPAARDAGVVITRLGAMGTPEWVQTASVPDTSVVGCSALRVVSDLASDGNPRVYVAGNFSILTAGSASTGTLACGPFSLPPQYVDEFHTEGYLLALDGFSGQPAWLAPVGSSDWFNSPESISVNPNGQISVGGSFTGDTAVFGGIRLPNPATAGPSNAFTAKLVQGYNLIQGTVFTDSNANGTQDASEVGRRNVVVEAQPGPLYYTTEASGEYSAVADLTTYTLSVPNPPRYYSVVPAGSTNAAFTTYGNRSGGHHFALQPTANQQDLRVTLTPVSRARPGFTVSYRLTCRNVGTVAVLPGSLHLAYDPRLAYVASSHVVSQTGTGLIWAIGALQPGQTVNIDVLFQLAINAQLGSQLTATATLAPLTGDLTPADNVETSTLTVTGSYDPNDIAVNYATLTLADVQTAARPLDYTIRFQNLGTDTAFTVVLRDTLPTRLLNLGTLYLLSASHTCVWRLHPGGVLTVSFPNARIPTRNVNTLRGMGFVRFRVVPYTTLVAGDLIPNAAHIHFDFNAPVTTNTALTTVLGPSGQAPTPNLLAGGAWPNPATSALRVAVEQPAGTLIRFSLADALGREVLSATKPAGAGGPTEHTFDLSGLPPGLYVVRAIAVQRHFSQRVVVRR